jgi:hypothetical protein
MNWKNARILRWVLRPLGLLLLSGAYGVGHILVSISAAVPSRQPPVVYLLSLVAFAFASAGFALLLEGHHLFDHIRISERWVSHAPRAIEESRWSSEVHPVDAEPAETLDLQTI